MKTHSLLLALFSLLLVCATATAAVSVTAGTNIVTVETGEYKAVLVNNIANTYHGAVQQMYWKDYSGTTNLASATYYDTLWLYRAGSIYLLGSVSTPSSYTLVEDNGVRAVLRFYYDLMAVNYYFYEDYYMYRFDDDAYTGLYDDGLAWRTRFDAPATAAENFGLTYVYGSKAGAIQTSLTSTNQDTYDLAANTISWTSWYGASASDLCHGAVMFAPTGSSNLASSNQDLGDGSADEVSYSAWAMDINNVDTWVQITAGGAGNSRDCVYNQYLLRANAPTFTGVQNYSSSAFVANEYIYTVTTSGTQNVRFNITGNGAWGRTTEKVYVSVSNVASGQIPYVHDGTSWTKPDYNLTGTTMKFYVTTPKSGTAQVYITKLDYPQMTPDSPVNGTVYLTPWVWFNTTATDTQGVTSCEYSINGSGYSSLTALNSTYYYKNVTIAEGSYYANFRCYDMFGEVNTTGNIDFIVALPPVITKESPLNQTYYQNWVWNNVTTDKPVANCTYSIDGAADVLMSNDTPTHFYYSVSGIATGSRNITTTCTCVAYGCYATTTPTYFTIAEVPQIVVESPLNQTYYQPDVWMNITATADPYGINSCEYSLDGAAGVAMSNDTASHFYAALDFTYDLGEHNVSFYCEDNDAGSNTTAPVFFTVSSPVYDCYYDLWTGFDYTSGNIEADNETITCRSTTLVVDGYIDAFNGGNLTFENAHITSEGWFDAYWNGTVTLNDTVVVFDSLANDGGGGFYVDTGGRLVLDNASVSSNSYNISFLVDGSYDPAQPPYVEIYDSSISDVGWDAGDYGVTVTQASITLKDSTVTSNHQSGAALMLTNATHVDIDGLTASYQNGGVSIYQNTAGATIYNSHFGNLEYGVSTLNSDNFTIRDSTFVSVSTGVSVMEPPASEGAITISGNNFSGGDTGIDMYYAAAYLDAPTEIYGNTITTMTTDGIDITSANDMRIHNNIISNIGQEGVSLHQTNNAQVYENDIAYTTYGIFVYPCINYHGTCYRTNNSYYDNTIAHCDIGIDVDVPPGWEKGYFTYTSVTGNNISDTNYGIFTDDASMYSHIADNTISNSDTGIYTLGYGGDLTNNTVWNSNLAYSLDTFTGNMPIDVHDNFDYNSVSASVALCYYEPTLNQTYAVTNQRSDDSIYGFSGSQLYTRSLTIATTPPDTIGVNADVGMRVYSCANATGSYVDPLTVTYDPANMAQEINVRLYTWDGIGWLRVDGSSVDTGNNWAVSPLMTEFSLFAPAEPLLYSCDNLFDGFCPGVYECPDDPDCQLVEDELFTADVPLTYINTTYTWTVRYINDLGDPIVNATVYALVTYPNFTEGTVNYAYDAGTGTYSTQFSTMDVGRYYIRVYGEHPSYDSGEALFYRDVYVRGAATMQITDTGDYSSFVCISGDTLLLMTEGLSCQYDDTECVDYHIEKERYCEFGCDNEIGCLSHPVIPGVTSSEQLAVFAWVALACLVISLIIMFVFPDLLLIGIIGAFIFGYLTYALMSAPLSYAGLAGILIALFLAVRGAL